MKKTLFIVLGFWLPIISFAQDGIKNEITNVDILSTQKFNGADISVFGIYLGMNKADVKKILEKQSELIVEEDAFNTKSKSDDDTKELRLYVYDKKKSGEQGECFLYIIWNDGSIGVDRITIYDDTKAFVKGDTKKLFTKEAINTNSAFNKKYFGTPTNYVEGEYTNMSFYKDKNIELIEYKNEKGNTYYFALTKKGKK